MSDKNSKSLQPYIAILGIAQDGGFPQTNCYDKCCHLAWENIENRRHVSCIAIIDPVSKEQWLIDATPDIKYQLKMLNDISKITNLSGVFLTHAHIGHYTGLMNFGNEAMGTKELSVYCMPKMKSFLKHNGPWNQLIKLNNIKIVETKNNKFITLNERLKIKPILVPHRDEYSETVGYNIASDKKSVLYVPDIDKWHLWNLEVNDLIKKTDYAFLDGTFFKNGELGRDMCTIPHPLVHESMQHFSALSKSDKQKIHFIHFNHTNPLLQNNSVEQKEVTSKGFRIAKEKQIIKL